VKALNCYFAMPFRKSARITVTNEGEQNVGSFYSNIDYQVVRSLPARCLYFHPKYRQATPNTAVHCLRRFTQSAVSERDRRLTRLTITFVASRRTSMESAILRIFNLALRA
jgi:hypothetical protein